MNPGYAVIGILYPGETRAQIMSAQGKVIIFDTPIMAFDFVPILANGRRCHWSADKETCCFSPIEPNGVNRVQILTGYDVYNTQAGTVPSEVKTQEWKHHIHWHLWYADCGQMQERNGKLVNLALPERD